MNKNETRLNNAKMWRDKEGYYLELEYIIETDENISKVVFPKVSFPIPDYYDVYYPVNNSPPFIDIHTGRDLYLNKGNIYFADGTKVKDVYSAEKIIKTKTKKMTVAEIEEALGHKVEIIAEE